MAIYHNGRDIPYADPKDPNSVKSFYGFTYPLQDGEFIVSSTWLINDESVLVGGSVDELVLSEANVLDNQTEAGLTAGVKGLRYRVTNRTSTNMRDFDDRSMYIKVQTL